MKVKREDKNCHTSLDLWSNLVKVVFTQYDVVYGRTKVKLRGHVTPE